MRWQARLPAALAAIHNFIRNHDPIDINDIMDPVDFEPGVRMEELAQGVPGAAERDHANERRDAIAQNMWDEYCASGGN